MNRPPFEFWKILFIALIHSNLLRQWSGRFRERFIGTAERSRDSREGLTGRWNMQIVG